MTITAIMLDTVSSIQKDLSTFINNYLHMEDDLRMDLSRKIFDKLRKFFQEQRILIDATKRIEPGVTNQFAPYLQREEEIMEIYEHAIMMHVDEPFQEYRKEMERIQDKLRVFWGADYSNLLSAIEAGLDEQTEAHLIRQINKDPEVAATMKQ